MIYLLKVLFPYIVLFYIVDCFVLVKKNHIAFFSNFGKKFGLKRRGLRFIGLSPICKIYDAIHLPFFANEKAILIWNKDSFDELDLYEEEYFEQISYDEVRDVKCVDEYIQLNNDRKIHLSSASLAKNISEKIGLLKNCPAQSRGREYESSFDNPHIIDEIEDRHPYSLYLIKLFSSAIFIFAFMILPTFLYLNLPLRIDILIYEIGLFYTLTVSTSVYTHKKIHKTNKGSLVLFFHFLFSPVSAVHALQMLTKNMTFNIEWTALAAKLLSADNFKTVLVKELKRVHFSKERCKNSDLMAFLLLKEKQYRKYFQDLKINQQVIFESPQQKDVTAHSYCPFCETEFQEGVDKCPDCDIRLVSFQVNGSE